MYSPELSMLFRSNNIDIKYENENVIINGSEYFKTYVEGYNEGIKYFNDNIYISPNTLYGTNAEQYVQDIHNKYNHTQFETFIGWSNVKTNTPYLINHEIIKKFGYYSGIVSKVDEMVEQYPAIFIKFGECKHNKPPQQIDNETVQEKIITKISFTSILTEKLNENKFFELEKVNKLNETSKEKLIEFISTNEVPYQIAMFDFLGFITYINKEYCNTKQELNKILAEILNSTERTIKGNISVLNDFSKENKERYTSYNYKETVIIDYQKLK